MLILTAAYGLHNPFLNLASSFIMRQSGQSKGLDTLTINVYQLIMYVHYTMTLSAAEL